MAIRQGKLFSAFILAAGLCASVATAVAKFRRVYPSLTVGERAGRIVATLRRLIVRGEVTTTRVSLREALDLGRYSAFVAQFKADRLRGV